MIGNITSEKHDGIYFHLKSIVTNSFRANKRHFHYQNKVFANFINFCVAEINEFKRITIIIHLLLLFEGLDSWRTQFRTKRDETCQSCRVKNCGKLSARHNNASRARWGVAWKRAGRGQKHGQAKEESGWTGSSVGSCLATLAFPGIY